MHLFDFIIAMTACNRDNTGNERIKLQSVMENDIVINITMSKMIRFPEIDRHQLTKIDSIVSL